MFIPESNVLNTSKIFTKIIKAFKLIGFRIEISSKVKIANFPDITFNLTNNTFKQFSKDNQIIVMSPPTTPDQLSNIYQIRLT